PVDNLPMLFHLFRKYPQAHFIVIGDYKYEVMKNYLHAFAEVSYDLVDARGKKGTCAGISDAITYIPDSTPFMLIWSDLILPREYEMPTKERDYVGIAKDFRCRWSYEEGIFKEEPSEVQGVAGHFIFTDKEKIKDVPAEGEFVRWLKEKNLSMEEYPLYHTKEYGLLSEYQKLTGSRCRPFNRITVEGDRIIKEGIDEQGRTLAVRENAWYQKVKDKNFKNVPRIYDTNPIVMERIDGKNIFEYDLEPDQKKEVLRQLIDCIREIHHMEGCTTDRDSFYDAYIGKTFKRLEKVEELVPFAKDEWITINGIKCRNVFFCKDWLTQKVMSYLPAEFRLLHGDCTFSNMMLRADGSPVMIDPRGYFGTTELYGDPAYDWVKLYYSLVGNYDQFNLKRFRLQIEEDEVKLQVDSNHWEDMEEDFFALLGEEVTRQQMHLLHAIIWLSLTTYAWEDYDSICGAFYNGLWILNEAMKEDR
nr:aminoglycoside phosphotransferase family protein [Lachnospiraceae bacterium]